MHGIKDRISLPLRIFLDADIFFDLAEEKRNIKSLINHLINDGHVLVTSITVMGEIVLVCIRDNEKTKDLHKIIDLLHFYDIRFLIPNSLLRECCRCLDRIDPNDRVPKTDKTHLAYAIAYNVNYFLTTDLKLQVFNLPEDCQLFSKNKRIVSPAELRKRLQI